MTTLTEFLLTRIAEDEAEAARDTSADESDPRRLFPWISPERALAECAAKRRIVELHAHVPVPTICPEHHPTALTHCGYCGSDCHLEDYLGPLLALPYTDHPDYREEWRP